MNRHLTMRTANPALNASTFKGLSISDSSNVMTINGTVNKTVLSLLFLMTTALYVWNLPVGSANVNGLMMVGVFGGLGVGILTAFKPHLAPKTVPIYALLEGLFLGGVSKFFDAMYPGIANQAIFLTFGILGALLLAYKSGLIKPTENFKLGVAAATGGVFFIYMASWILSFFGVNMPGIHGNSTMSIIFSLVVIGIAAMNLVLDFDFIEEGAEKGAPKYMEWYGAFGLLVTLIWLYLEIIRLLAKLNSRR